MPLRAQKFPKHERIKGPLPENGIGFVMSSVALWVEIKVMQHSWGHVACNTAAAETLQHCQECATCRYILPCVIMLGSANIVFICFSGDCSLFLFIIWHWRKIGTMEILSYNLIRTKACSHFKYFHWGQSRFHAYLDIIVKPSEHIFA